MNRRHLLERLVKEHGWRLGAELGVFKGDTYLHLLAKCPRLTLIGVDTWEPQPEKERLRAVGGRSYESFDLPEFELRVKRKAREYGSRAVLLKMTTDEAASHVEDGSLDFVFIDADHLYEGVSRDIDTWWPKVREGGWLLGHDYQKTFPGVMRAVDERFTPKVFGHDSVWGVAK